MPDKDIAVADSRWIWPFELLERIGEGGMGEVYRARYVVKNIDVALKMLPSDVQDSTTLARFEQEMEVLTTLRHPNIVRCFGGKCEDKQRFYAMELIRNGTLDDELRERERFSWERVIEYAKQMCAALDFSHEKGIVHRDVKPSNFLIADDGTLRLSDFGLATVAAKRRLTQAGKTAGTFLYMAPEQIRGGTITPQTDLYALGCVLFELLTGQPPFVGETPAATLHMHCKTTPPRLTEFALDCPPALERLVLRLLEKQASNRPESAAEVARELRNIGTTVEVISPARTIDSPKRNEPVVAGTRELAATQQHQRIDSPRPKWRKPVEYTVCALALLLLVWNLFLLGGESRFQKSHDMWLKASESSSDQVRIEAAKSLSEIGDTDGVNRLMEMLEHDSSISVRTAAANAIGSLGADANDRLPALIRIQKGETEPQVRNALMQTIQSAKGKSK